MHYACTILGDINCLDGGDEARRISTNARLAVGMSRISAATIWSLADIAYIAIHRDMSKISRYCIAIFLSIFIEQLFINNHSIFMQVEAALLWWRHKNKHIKML